MRVQLLRLFAFVFLAFVISPVNAQIIFDGGFEQASAQLGIVADPSTARPGQIGHDANPNQFIDPPGPNTGWFLQNIPGVEGGGSIDVVSRSLGFGRADDNPETPDPLRTSPNAIMFGDRAVDLIGTPFSGALNQIIETVPGQRYELSYWLSSNQQNEDTMFSPDRIVDGIVVQTSPAPEFGIWHEFSVAFDASGVTAQIGFFGQETTGSRRNVFDSTVPGTNIQLFDGEAAFGALLDNVSVTVPEPSMMAPMAFLAIFTNLKRRRREHS